MPSRFTRASLRTAAPGLRNGNTSAAQAGPAHTVFGNGNVFDADGCLQMLKQTGCDGIALGRIAIARLDFCRMDRRTEADAGHL